MRIHLLVVAATLAFVILGTASASPIASGASALHVQSGIELAKWGHGRHAHRHLRWCRGPKGLYRCKYEDYHQHWR